MGVVMEGFPGESGSFQRRTPRAAAGGQAMFAVRLAETLVFCSEVLVALH